MAWKESWHVLRREFLLGHSKVECETLKMGTGNACPQVEEGVALMLTCSFSFAK